MLSAIVLDVLDVLNPSTLVPSVTLLEVLDEHSDDALAETLVRLVLERLVAQADKPVDNELAVIVVVMT